MEADPLNIPSPVCPGCARRDRELAQLRAEVQSLKKTVETLSRSSKRQAAPFSKGLPKANPKKPGRKPGDDYGTHCRRAIPPVIDEVYEAPLPERCPRCGGNLIASHVDQQYQSEIPRRAIHRQFNVAVGRCACCDGRVQGRHPLQTSDALGACASQVGPEAQAAAVMLNKELGLSQGKISCFFQKLFGIQLSRGGSCRIMLRAADRCEENYQSIVKHVRQSPWIVPDETGWRIGGWSAWLHAAVGQDVVAYLIHRQRGADAAALLIGWDYAGKLIHDGLASYNRFLSAIHQMCLGHPLRRCHEILEKATRGAVCFPRAVKALLQKALLIRDRRDAGQIQLQTAARWASSLNAELQKLTEPIKCNAENERLANHLYYYSGRWFNFLKYPDIDATNHQAEQALRPAVVNRKVWGGNRTEAGAVAQSILMSVLFTAAKQGRDALEFISQVLRARPHQRPLLIPSG
jgi:transposase